MYRRMKKKKKRKTFTDLSINSFSSFARSESFLSSNMWILRSYPHSLTNPPSSGNLGSSRKVNFLLKPRWKLRGHHPFFLKYYNYQMFLNIVNRKFGPINFLSTGTRRNTNMFNGSAKLTKFDRRKSDKSYSKDPYLLCRKALRNGIDLRQDRFLSMRRLSTLLPFGNLSLGGFFSVDLSFRRRRSINVTCAVAGNSRFHHIKIVAC